MLVNVNMVDDERAVKNVSNKTKGISYKAYDEPEYDEFGMVCRTVIIRLSSAESQLGVGNLIFL